MRFRLLFIFFLFLSCDPQLTTVNFKQPYMSKGFAYIYNDKDFIEKKIKNKMNNEILQI